MTDGLMPPADGPSAGDRMALLVTSLGATRSRIADACSAAGRDARTVTLIAVTKTYPADDVATLVRLGVADVGESKDQEASAKVTDTADLLSRLEDIPAGVPRWHFVGQLQRRKARSVATYAHSVQSVDRAVLVAALAEGVARAERPPLEIFLQLSLDGNPERGGASAEEIAVLADAVAAQDGLILRGLMAVAPMGLDPEAAFAGVAEAAALLRSTHPDADAISAGMSGDFETAIRYGATHVRVGTALLGRRAEIFD